MDALASDVELLKKVLLYHVVSGDIRSSAAENNIKLDSVQGAPILVNLYLKSEYYDGFITINGKKVMKADIVADNGVLHIGHGSLRCGSGGHSEDHRPHHLRSNKRGFRQGARGPSAGSAG